MSFALISLGSEQDGGCYNTRWLARPFQDDEPVANGGGIEEAEEHHLSETADCKNVNLIMR